MPVSNTPSDRRMVAFLQRLDKDIRRLTGDGWPADYCVVDIESSGFSREKDLICEFGLCLVQDHQWVDRNSFVLNWYALGDDVVPHSWLTDRLLRVARQMELGGSVFSVTPQRMREEGVHPQTALRWIYDYLSEIKAQKLIFVSHNGLGFDMPMLCASFEKDLRLEFTLDPNRVLDTSAIAKAAQLIADHPGALPKANETLHAYFRRIAGWRAAGIKHNLPHCIQMYNLVQAADSDLEAQHTAGQDAYVTHLLLEHFRSQAHQVAPEPGSPAAPLVFDEELQWTAPPLPPLEPPKPPRKAAAASPITYKRQRSR